MRTTLFFSFLLFTVSTTADQNAAAQFSKGADLEQAIAEERFRQITSVLVARDGELIYENYWGDGSRTVLNDTRSAMKTLVAMAAGAAIADGHIESIDEPVFKHFAAERPYRFSTQLKDEVTLRDLLTMSSALDCNDNEWESPGNEEHMYPARRWVYFVVDMPTKADYRRDDAGYGPFSYCTAGSFFVGQVIERASGQAIDEYIEKRLLRPMGIHEVSWDRSPSGEVMTGGGAELTSRDLLKLGALLLNEGRYKNQQLLPASWVADMMRIHRRANDRQNYGLQIWNERYRCGADTTDVWYMGGNGGNKIAIFPDIGVVAVVTATLYGTSGMHQQSHDILEQFVLPGINACR